MNSIRKKIKDKFIKTFNQEPLMVRSPARVNIIGEHTDYNEGFVLPSAIDKEIVVAISKSDDKSKLYSLDLDDSYEFDINNIQKIEKTWTHYILGVIEELKKLDLKIENFNCVFGGDIPMGSGLSSSAALECAVSFALNELFNLNLEKIDLVKISQKAENNFVGVKCGIMDQFISVFGKKDKVLKLDCKTLEYEYFPFDFKDVKILLLNSQVKHSLASSEYNKRHEECENGVSILKKYDSKINSLRDVSIDLLDSNKNKMSETVYKRCKYVINENQRLFDLCEALKINNLELAGKLIYKSHDGLKNDYEVSCKELDILIDLVKDDKDVYGARMMGGGFGGCTINIVKENSINKITERVFKEYKSITGKELEFYTGKIENGTSII